MRRGQSTPGMDRSGEMWRLKGHGISPLKVRSSEVGVTSHHSWAGELVPLLATLYKNVITDNAVQYANAPRHITRAQMAFPGTGKAGFEMERFSHKGPVPFDRYDGNVERHFLTANL